MLCWLHAQSWDIPVHRPASVCVTVSKLSANCCATSQSCKGCEAQGTAWHSGLQSWLCWFSVRWSRLSNQSSSPALQAPTLNTAWAEGIQTPPGKNWTLVCYPQITLTVSTFYRIDLHLLWEGSAAWKRQDARRRQGTKAQCSGASMPLSTDRAAGGRQGLYMFCTCTWSKGPVLLKECYFHHCFGFIRHSFSSLHDRHTSCLRLCTDLCWDFSLFDYDMHQRHDQASWGHLLESWTTCSFKKRHKEMGNIPEGQ